MRSRLLPQSAVEPVRGADPPEIRCLCGGERAFDRPAVFMGGGVVMERGVGSGVLMGNIRPVLTG